MEEVKKKITYTDAQKKAIYAYRLRKKEAGGSQYTEAAKQSIKKWREENREKYNESSKKYYQNKIKNNPQKIAERKEAYKLTKVPTADEEFINVFSNFENN